MFIAGPIRRQVAQPAPAILLLGPAQAGTSFASPIMAAIQSLVNQKIGSRQGNPNPVYCQLGSAEYG